jgi:hypothetical protein
LGSITSSSGQPFSRAVEEGVLLGGNGASLRCDGQANFPFPGLCIHYFKKHVPEALDLEHERIRHKRSRHI